MNILAAAGLPAASRRFYGAGQAPDAAHADHRHRRVEHDARGPLDGLGRTVAQSGSEGLPVRVIEQALGGQDAPGETGAAQGRPGRR
jgi:hypothetical protein